MQHFPKSIESHLRTAGLAATEILILRHMADSSAYTLRQLASRTGKSTGVLDQAVRKLVLRKIIHRTNMNGVPSYTLASPDAMTRWINEQSREELTMLRRKEQDIHNFFKSIQLQKQRPQLDFYEGVEGIQKAYRQLIQESSDEILGFLPMEKGAYKPLSFWQQGWTKERRRQHIGCRIIAHDSANGRRLQSRDDLEERKTILVPVSDCPIRVSQFIAGEAMICVDEKQQQACRLHFPHFAASQRSLFESIWTQHECENSDAEDVISSLDSITLSELEFCSPISVPLLCGHAR